MQTDILNNAIDNIVNRILTHNTEFLSLMGGLSGYILAIQFINSEENRTIRLLHLLTIKLNQRELIHTFSSGYAGLYHTLATTKLIDKFEKKSTFVFEEKLRNSIDDDILWSRYDFLHGYLGILFTLLDSESPTVKEISNKFFSHLSQSKKEYKKGHYIWTSKTLDGSVVHDLGLAHGLASIVAVLSMAYSKQIHQDICFDLINGSINTFKSVKLKDSISCYSQSLEDNYNSRLAWCYGDLGIARSIWLAGVACNREDWKQEAVDIMLHAAKRRDLQKNGVVDAGICHGTAGIAHIFNRFYRDTQLDAFKDATDYWIDQTLKMAKFKDGLAGYKSWQGPKLGWKNEYGLLEGIAGIGLVLHSYLHPEIEPTWDRCLLLS